MEIINQKNGFEFSQLDIRACEGDIVLKSTITYALSSLSVR